MPIQVTCPKCLKRFQVSEKFAGKSGPCPACKNVIKVPDVDEQVTIHAPDDGSPKDSTGKSVLKPIERQETEVTKKGLIFSIAGVALAVGAAIAMRVTGGTPLIGQIAGILLLAPPLVWAGYQFVYDSELAPYRGSELRNRVLICSALFAAMWLVYAFVPAYVMELDKASEMSYMILGIVVCVMLVGGAFISVATFELEFFGGLIHSGLYYVAVILLAVIAGVTLAGVEPEPYGPRGTTDAAASDARSGTPTPPTLGAPN